MKQDIKQKIEDAVAAFCTKEVFEAGIELFDTLGYDTSLRSPLDEKTFSEFESLYIESSVNKERFNKKNAFCNDWKSIDILFQLTDDSFTNQGKLFDSTVNPLNPQSYLCFAVELSKSEYTKTQLARITREINKLFPIPILVVFKYGEYITLSVINRRVNKKDSDRDVLEKVTLIKDIVFANPHRAHIEILCDMSIEELTKTYDIHSFETLHKAWAEVLDTQTLNKRFYTELSNWYFWAMQTVEYPNSSDNAKNLIRLLTRLLFVWFIKEKDLIPEEFFDENKIQSIITVFNPHTVCESENKENESIYYKAILQNLFFASLNAEQGKRAFRIDGQNQNATNLMRYKRFLKAPDEFIKLIESKVPFMNGGLFECLDHADEELKGKQGGAVIDYEDGFSDRKDNALFVPDYIFFAKDVLADLSKEYDDKKKKDVVVNGIIRILQKYKFTVQENTPVEEDIALDPELLGRVFENLLASYNPETKTNARKQTGSFYTPRAIVEYMVDESLKAYLKTKIASALQIENVEQKLSDLIAYNDKQADFTDEERIAILRYLDECKILDPACGSGAFPMGILQKMVYVIHKLDPQNDNWKQIQIQKISSDKSLSAKEKNELQKEILSVFDDNELDYARKLYLIENCIHGIDIQPIATQISRLRFFISLIVDQKANKEKANFGVRPLPNLENRLVTANSLIGLDGENVLTSKKTDELTSELQKVRHELFKAKTPKYKKALRERDKEIREELKDELLQLGFGEENALLISKWNPYDKNKSADFFDAEWMFGVKDGFDIVIGNPPYGFRNVLSKEEKDYFRKKLKLEFKSGDSAELFVKISFDRFLAEKGILTFIIPKKSLYGEAWEDTRINYWGKNNFLYSLDTGKSFDNVLLEAAVFGVQKNPNINSKIMLGFLQANGDIRSFQADNYNSILSKFKTLQIYSVLNKDLYNKIQSKSIDAHASGKLGLTIGTDFYSDESKEFKLLKGIDIGRYEIRSHRFLANQDKLNWNNAKEFLKPKILCQRLVAHIMNPVPHLKFAATYDDEGILITNTITSFVIPNGIDEKFFIGYLNSTFTAWYAYNFIYCQAIRGMDLYDFYIRQLPIPNATAEQQKPIIDLVDKILAAKKAEAQADTSKEEAEIDSLVYKLYGLTEAEIKIVEGR